MFFGHRILIMRCFFVLTAAVSVTDLIKNKMFLAIYNVKKNLHILFGRPRGHFSHISTPKVRHINEEVHVSVLSSVWTCAPSSSLINVHAPIEGWNAPRYVHKGLFVLRLMVPSSANWFLNAREKCLSLKSPWKSKVHESFPVSPPQCWKARSWACPHRTRSRRLLPADLGWGCAGWDDQSRNPRQLRRSTDYQGGWGFGGGVTLVFFLIADGTGRRQQTPELNRYTSRSVSGPLRAASCLKLLFINTQIGEKAFFFPTCEVYTLVFFIFLLCHEKGPEKNLVWL